jgi:hypothetical protein
LFLYYFYLYSLARQSIIFYSSCFINPLVYLCFCIYFHLSGVVSILFLWSLGCFWTIMPNIARYRPRDVGFSIRSSSIIVYTWYRGRLCCLLLLAFVDSGLKLVSNSLSKFGVFFLAGGSVIPLAISIIGYFLVLLLLFIDLYISIIKSNTNILFVVSCSSSSVISRDSNYIISISINLIERYLDIILCIKISNIISSWIIIVSTCTSIESS